jgi:hypothetical protein
MEKKSVPHETVHEWQTASATIRENVQQQTQARVAVVSVLNSEKVCKYNQRPDRLELTFVGEGR